MAIKKAKKAKQVYAFRLSETTKKQLILMSDYDETSEAEMIAYAIERLYVNNYHREMPDTFPNIRYFPDILIPPLMPRP